MKKTFISLMSCIFAFSAYAQQPAGTWSIQPKVGITLSSLTSFPDYAEGKMKVGSRIGAEVAYQVLPELSFAGGLYHTIRGNKFSKLVHATVQDKSTSALSNEITFIDPSTLPSLAGVGGELGVSLHYIDVPITANYYLFKGFSLKAGVQMGFLTQAKMKGLEQFWDSDNLKDYLQKIDISIPVGISYEISKVKIDARYHWGLTNIGDKMLRKYTYTSTGDIATINQIGINTNMKNSYFTLTVGYLIGL